MKSNGLAFLFALVFLLTACGSAPQTAPPPSDLTEAPFTGPETAIPATESPNSLSVEDQLTQVDSVLRKSAQASIAYNAPSEMRVEETVTVELLLNPNLSPADLKKEVSEPGTVRTSSVEITPLMKARLVPQDRSAFLIDARPDEEHAIQVINPNETTKWSWNVTARKSGTQRMTISLSRLVKYDDQEYWREVGEYEAAIVVQVTPLSWFKTSGWKWVIVLLVFMAVIVFGLLRRSSQRGAGPEAKTISGRTHPAGENLGRIFISYRRSDSADVTGRIYDCLVDEFGRAPIFKDVDSIPLGVDFKAYLDRKIRECKVVLAIIGDHWLDARNEAGRRRLDDPADFVRIEIEAALESGIPVIPLLVCGVKMPLEKDLPTGLQQLVYKNGIPIRPDPDFHHDMERLIAALNKYVA